MGTVLTIDEPAKWKTRELRQIHTADPIGMDLQTVVPVHYTGI